MHLISQSSDCNFKEREKQNWLMEMVGEDDKISQLLTRTLAAKALEGPLFARVFKATSAAACSACLRVEKNVGLSKVSPLKLTVALKRGAWSGPSRMHE